MIKKKAKRAGKTEKGKSKAKKGAKRTGAIKGKKPLDPAEVRKDIAKIVGLEAMNMTEAAMEEAMKGLVAPTKFLFEVARIFPAAVDEDQATQEEDCLAKTLLERLNISKKPAQEEEDDEPALTADAEEERNLAGAREAEGEKTGTDVVLAE